MRILTSGSAWVGDEFGSIQTAVEQAIDYADHEIVLVTYALSTAADTTLRRVGDALERGVAARIVVNRFADQHQAAQRSLRALLAKYERLRVFDFCDRNEADLHAKFLVVDHKVAIVGSANVSWRGMVSNHELAIFIDNQSLVDSVLVAAGQMLRSPMITELE